MVQPTVVTAYYPIPSKFPIEKYLGWMMHFWPKTNCPLIFFTDPGIVPLFQDMLKGRKGLTQVIGLPFNELSAFKKLCPEAWIRTRANDPENTRHTPELYAIWYEKKEFILRAIEKNPFGSQHFVWCDAGICRNPGWVERLQEFPKRDMIPPQGRMLLLRIAPFNETDYFPDKNGIAGNFGERVSIGGGVLAADIKGWISWSKAYDAMLMRYYLANRFIGKDQNIIASMIIENPEIAFIIDPPPTMNIIDRWFYLLFFLAAAPPPC
jgi:hypothetical protein